MPHSKIIGMTESGKTTLAKQLSKEYQQRKIPVIVLDPLGDPGWSDNPDSEYFYQTDNKAVFLSAVRASRSCAVFIDEAGESVGQYDREMYWLATRGRHYGHNCHFLAQRAQQIAKTVRDQCGRLYLFNCSLDDAKTLANEWNKPELKEAYTLKQGEFFAVSRFGSVVKLSAFGKPVADKIDSVNKKQDK